MSVLIIWTDEKTKKDRKKKFQFKAQEREEQKKKDIYYRDISKRKLWNRKKEKERQLSGESIE